MTPSAEIFLEGNKDGERAGYEILWRETTEARWSVVKTVEANVAAAAARRALARSPPRAPWPPAPPPSSSLEENLSLVLSSVSTDNHYFAARSVGKNGKKSIAVPAVAAVRRPPGYVPADAPKPAGAPAPSTTAVPKK